MAAHARLKNVFTEDEKYHNLMSRLKDTFLFYHCPAWRRPRSGSKIMRGSSDKFNPYCSVDSQQTQNVSVTFLESCSLVASDLTLQKRFYNVLSDLCLEMSNIQKHLWFI